MKDLIILGMGPTRVDCPFDAEVWGVNNGYRQVIPLKGKLDKLFICHQDQEYDYMNDPIFNWEELEIVAETGVEIVTLFDVPHIKKYTKMDFTSLVDYFNTNYFSDSLAYMIAYALYHNTHKDENGLIKLNEPMRIRMYGVDMHTKDEYATERGGIEYFIAVAKTIGVDFWVHAESSVCKTESGQPYGFFKKNIELIDPKGVLELQKTPEGVQKIFEMGIVDEDIRDKMLKAISKNKHVVATIPDKWNLIFRDIGKYITTQEELDNYHGDPDYIFLPHWSWKIPEHIYTKYNCVIFHMTDLPFGRGGTPLQNLISRGIYETQISAIRATETIDGGPVYLKRPLSLYGTAEEIYTRCANTIREMMEYIIENKPEPVPQTGEPVVFTRRKKDDSLLPEDYSKVFDHIRMLDAEGYPKAFIDFGNYRMEFTRASQKSDEIIADVRIWK